MGSGKSGEALAVARASGDPAEDAGAVASSNAGTNVRMTKTRTAPTAWTAPVKSSACALWSDPLKPVPRESS